MYCETASQISIASLRRDLRVVTTTVVPVVCTASIVSSHAVFDCPKFSRKKAVIASSFETGTRTRDPANMMINRNAPKKTKSVVLCFFIRDHPNLFLAGAGGMVV
jgi:hypothetical protein